MNIGKAAERILKLAVSIKMLWIKYIISISNKIIGTKIIHRYQIILFGSHFSTLSSILRWTQLPRLWNLQIEDFTTIGGTPEILSYSGKPGTCPFIAGAWGMCINQWWAWQVLTRCWHHSLSSSCPLFCMNTSYQFH